MKDGARSNNSIAFENLKTAFLKLKLSLSTAAKTNRVSNTCNYLSMLHFIVIAEANAQSSLSFLYHLI